MKCCRRLIFLFDDHLSHGISSLDGADRDIVLMCEVAEETTYVKHHKKKIVLILSAMRHFADELRIRGFSVRYVQLDDADISGSFAGELSADVAIFSPDCVVVTEPGEWRVRPDVLRWQSMFGVPVNVRPDRRFLCSREEFAAWADERRTLTMEFFYRLMRRKTKLLMQGPSRRRPRASLGRSLDGGKMCVECIGASCPNTPARTSSKHCVPSPIFSGRERRPWRALRRRSATPSATPTRTTYSA